MMLFMRSGEQFGKLFNKAEFRFSAGAVVEWVVGVSAVLDSP